MKTAQHIPRMAHGAAALESTSTGKVAAGLVVALALNGAAVAATQNTATAILQGIQFSVTDLDPDDGIAAGWTWAGDSTNFLYVGARVATSLNATATEIGQQIPGVPRGFVVQDGLSDANSSANFSRSSDGNSAFASSLGSDTFAGADSVFRIDGGISLTPHSSLTISAMASVALQAIDHTHGLVVFQEDQWRDFARAEVVLQGGLSPIFPSFNGFQEARIPLEFDALTSPGGSMSTTNAVPLSITIVNNSAAAVPIDLAFASYVHVASHGEVSPVPEPQSWALLAAGLAVLTGQALRRPGRKPANG